MHRSLFLEAGILFFLATLIKFVILRTQIQDLKTLIFRLIFFRLNVKNPEFGISLFQIIGIYWFAVGLFYFLLGDPVIKGFFGILEFIVIYVAPIWILAALTEHKNKQ